MKINQEKYAEKLCCLYLVIYIYILYRVLRCLYLVFLGAEPVVGLKAFD